MVKWVKKGIHCENFAFISDPRVAPMIKSVTDQMLPRGSTETHSERLIRQAEERHRARRGLRKLAAYTELMKSR